MSARVKVRPEFVKAMDFVRTIKKAPRQRVILTVHEMKRLGRGDADPTRRRLADRWRGGRTRPAGGLRSTSGTGVCGVRP
ncbi:hypothetical protein ACFQMH_31750 [Streptomyces viridiviolaceus]|uniref:Uncharacterized protein n=1 Tax=Streptomyces viridiviolaceus TaxID=68282 RepID=A0ABW2EBN0_9ACTN